MSTWEWPLSNGIKIVIALNSDTYLSLSTTSEGLYKEKGSKFLAFAYPVETEEQIKEILDGLKKKYYDARHHCYAFVLKSEEGKEEAFRANDAGEPPHSAGDPILGQIRSHNLLDALVVVVRYFGGTKLGVSGLINAYRTAAADAIDKSQIVEKVVKRYLKIEYAYAATSEVMQLIQQYTLDIEEQDFGENCYYQLGIRQGLWKEVKNKLEQIPGVTLLH